MTALVRSARRAPNLAPAIITQVKTAFAAKNRAAALVGVLIGGFVPLATYMVAHVGALTWLSWALVAGGMLYSAPTVWRWVHAFAGPVKATGFVVLLEGIMVASPIHGLGISAGALLVGINAVATACALARGARP